MPLMNPAISMFERAPELPLPMAPAHPVFLPETVA